MLQINVHVALQLTKSSLKKVTTTTDSVMVKTVNGFKTKLERAKKMGLFLD